MRGVGRQISRDEVTVGCICPLGVELAAVQSMLDEDHGSITSKRDTCTYQLGRIGAHAIAVATLPETGNNTAASVAGQLLDDFEAIRFGLLVGVGGGIPNERNDVRLGDVVVSKGLNNLAAVVQLDLGKQEHGGLFRRTGALAKPPQILLDAINRLNAIHKRQGSKMQEYLDAMIADNPHLRDEHYVYQGSSHDQLFDAEYVHVAEELPTCDLCDRGRLVPRVGRDSDAPWIHYGPIGSGNAVIRDAEHRTALQKQGFLCVEMEAAGLMNNFKCLVIRGICDYADSHKNKRWQPYAAATAAAYMKELLHAIPPSHLKDAEPVVQSIGLPQLPAEVGGSSPRPESDMTGSHHRSTSSKVPETTTPKNTRWRSSSLGSSHEIWAVPHPQPKIFIGRQSLFASMKTMCVVPASPKKRTHPRVFGLAGPAGCGKSIICLKFAHDFRERFWGVFWIDATSIRTIETSLASITTQLNQSRWSEIRGDMDPLQRLGSIKQTWLMIFDGADDTTLDLNPFIPINAKGVVLITSRNTAVKDYAPEAYQEMLLPPAREAAELFTEMVKRYDRAAVITDTEAIGVARAVSYLPMALVQAASHVGKNLYNAKEYPKILKADPHTLLNRKVWQSAQPQVKTVYEVLDSSLEHLKSLGSDTSKDAIHLVNFIASIYHTGYLEAIIESAWVTVQNKISDEEDQSRAASRVMILARSSQRSALLRSEHGLGWLQASDKWDRESTREAVHLLHSMSILSIQNKSYNDIYVHPIIHSWMYDRIEVSMKQDSFMSTCWTLAMAISDKGGIGPSEDHTQRVLRHIHACLECPGLRFQITACDDYDLMVIHSLLDHVFWLADPQAVAFLAQKWYHTIGFSKQYEENRTIAMMDILVLCYNNIDGKSDVAETIAENALTLAERSYGSNDAKTVAGTWHLARQRCWQGKYDSAIALIEPTLEGDGPPGTSFALQAHALDTLAESYLRKGNIGQAIYYQSQANDARAAIQPDTANLLCKAAENLCEMYLARGDVSAFCGQAESTYLHRKSVYGELSPPSLRAKGFHANARYLQGAVQEACSTLVTCQTMQETVLGRSHKDTLHTILLLSEIYADRKMWAEAETLVSRYLESKRLLDTDVEVKALPLLYHAFRCTAMIGRSSQAHSLWVQYWENHQRLLRSDMDVLLDATYMFAIEMLEGTKSKDAAYFLIESFAFREKFYTATIGQKAYSTTSIVSFFQRYDYTVADANLADILIETVQLTHYFDRTETLARLQRIAVVFRLHRRWAGCIRLWEKIYEERKGMYGKTGISTVEALVELERLHDSGIADGRDLPCFSMELPVASSKSTDKWTRRAKTAVSRRLHRLRSRSVTDFERSLSMARIKVAEREQQRAQELDTDQVVIEKDGSAVPLPAITGISEMDGSYPGFAELPDDTRMNSQRRMRPADLPRIMTNVGPAEAVAGQVDTSRAVDGRPHSSTTATNGTGQWTPIAANAARSTPPRRAQSRSVTASFIENAQDRLEISVIQPLMRTATIDSAHASVLSISSGGDGSPGSDRNQISLPKRRLPSLADRDMSSVEPFGSVDITSSSGSGMCTMLVDDVRTALPQTIHEYLSRPNRGAGDDEPDLTEMADSSTLGLGMEMNSPDDATWIRDNISSLPSCSTATTSSLGGHVGGPNMSTNSVSTGNECDKRLLVAMHGLGLRASPWASAVSLLQQQQKQTGEQDLD